MDEELVRAKQETAEVLDAAESLENEVKVKSYS
jgi:hypothetical protein